MYQKCKGRQKGARKVDFVQECGSENQRVAAVEVAVYLSR